MSKRGGESWSRKPVAEDHTDELEQPPAHEPEPVTLDEIAIEYAAALAAIAGRENIAAHERERYLNARRAAGMPVKGR